MEERLFRKALILEALTVGYNLLEAAASIAAGVMASSIALFGFGLDSIVESLSGLLLIRRLRRHGKVSPEEEEKTERRTVRFVGVTFLVLALYIGVESVRKILGGAPSEASYFGIAIAAASCLVMPLLGIAKLRLGRRLGLRSLVADAHETLACFALSLALLAGLVCRAAFGFALADPLAGLVIAAYLVKEGRELLFENKNDEGEGGLKRAIPPLPAPKPGRKA